jgi:Fusaric acid resistance protein-like
MFKLSRKLAFPLFGLGTVAGIIQEVIQGGTSEAATEVDKQNPTELVQQDILKAITYLDRPCSELNTLCREGIEHIMCTLHMGKYAKPSLLSRLFSKKPSSSTDDEIGQDLGTDAFLIRFDTGVEAFKAHRTDNLDEFYDEKRTKPSQGLFIILFVEFLMMAVAQEIRELIVFVDNLRVAGELTRKRLIYPKMKVFRKALIKLFHVRRTEDIAGAGFGGEDGDVYTEDFTGRVNRKTASILRLMLETSVKPLTNNPTLKAITSVLLSIGNFFRSEYSVFGLRAACATFAGTIPAFLSSSFNFYNEYRGVWITITVILGMSPTTGSSINGLVARSFGTIAGGLAAMAAWYIVDGHVAGVIVFSLVTTALRICFCNALLILDFYFFLQDPRRV